MSIRMDDIHINNLKVIGAGNNWNQHKNAVTFMQDKQLNMDLLITDRLSLEEFETGISHARTRPAGFVKAVFTFDD